MNGRDFLPIAKQLARGSTEAEWRSAISRAYYAAFHVASDMMKSWGFAVPRAERAHVYLSRRLYNSGNPEVQKAGSDLGMLRGDRNYADYDVHRPLTQNVALLKIVLTENIIQACEAARNDPTRARIIDAIRTYERDVLQEVTWQP